MATESSTFYRELKTIINSYSTRVHLMVITKIIMQKENLNVNYIKFIALLRNVNFIFYSIKKLLIPDITFDLF